MLLHSGTTTVGDIEALPELLPEVWNATPLRVISFLEMTGVRSRREPELILREAQGRIESLSHRRCAAALSPHAPYSTPADLLRLTATAARRKKLRVAIHVAESATEFEMFRHARGEMFDWLARNERDMSDCGGVSPVQHLARQRALGRHLLAIHVNYLANGDAALLAEKGVSVVHCPRSHDYFGHATFPGSTLTKAGVNICLGTDSLATVRNHPRDRLELNLFHELRAFAGEHPKVAPAEIVRLVTIAGAQALGLRGQVGELSPGAFADFIALPFTGKMEDLHAAVLHHSGNVAACMINGAWAIAPH
jgi:cytosine/adenosine deaminase-related metal-dependent hydrolase